MKKQFCYIALIILLLVLCVAFVSCKDEEGEVPKNELLDISKLSTSGYFPDARYHQNKKILNYFTGGENDSGSHSLGIVDLRRYSAINVYYGSAENLKEIGNLTLKTKDGEELASVKCVPAKGWGDLSTKITIDVSEIRHKEEIIMTLAEAQNGIVVHTIEMIYGDSFGLYMPTNDDGVYICGDGSDLTTYYEKNKSEYEAACQYYKDNGFEVYNSSKKNGNFFTTLTKGAEMAHIYWLETERELNIIYSLVNGAKLPPKTPAVTTGNTTTTVTQLKGNGNETMGYVIQLADGSFIVYDGGDASCAGQLIETLNDLKIGNDITVRAWVLTVEDDAHIGCFKEIASKNAGDIKLETVIAAPVYKKFSSPYGKTYLSSALKEDVEKFNGAKLCYVHTGMDFTFCNVKMEILFTAEELYISDPPRADDTTGEVSVAEFGNTSLVSRISTENTSMLVLSDCGAYTARRMGIYYGNYLESNICQMGQHGKGDIPLYIYNMIAAPIVFCPTTSNVFAEDAMNKEVRDVLASSPVTQMVILLDSDATTVNMNANIVKPENTPLEVAYEYTCLDGEKIEYYLDVTEDEVISFCEEIVKRGFKKTQSNKTGDNLSTTMIKGSEMIHMYWYSCEKRMTVVNSAKGAESLPAKPKVTTGNINTTVTQLKSTEINGMGYVIQLADGSFMIYDGGYDKEDILEELWGVLNELTPKGKEIIIRAWILTHSHGDHYGTFVSFSNKYAEKVKLETVIVSPTTEKERALQKNDGYLMYNLKNDVAKFAGAKICNVFPGMILQFCNVVVEIMDTYHDSYILSTVKGTSNNTSIISRIYANNGKMLFLADAGMDQAEHLATVYKDHLLSNACQVSHHGVEDFPLIVYRQILPSVLWYPCNTELYNLKNRDADVRAALKNSRYVEEILLHDTRITKAF